MKMLITKDELETLKSNDLVPFECEICKSTFHKKKHYALRGLKGTRNYSACSKECWRQVLKNRKPKQYITLICEWCQKSFSRHLSLYKKSNVKLNKKCFCSQSCVASWQSKNTKGKSLRSKLEIWIEAELKKRFSSLNIIFNERKAVNGELDIYIPSLNLAIEINGIYHYEPIYGDFNLSIRQSKDRIKKEDCLMKHIDLFVVDARQFSKLNGKIEKEVLHQISKKISENLERVSR